MRRARNKKSSKRKRETFSYQIITAIATAIVITMIITRSLIVIKLLKRALENSIIIQMNSTRHNEQKADTQAKRAKLTVFGRSLFIFQHMIFRKQ